MATADDTGRPPASDGRIPGPRGMATRKRLIDCTANLVVSTPYSDLRVTDIARAAGTSPATFYQYFVDLDAALLVLAQQTTEVGVDLAKLIEERGWSGKSGYDSAAELVESFLGFWQDHLPVLRVVDLLTEEGDARFRRARVHMLNTITTSLAHAIESVSPAARSSPDAPMATAAALVSMLAHVAAHRQGMESWAISFPELKAALTRQIYWGINSPEIPA